jgi:integrase
VNKTLTCESTGGNILFMGFLGSVRTDQKCPVCGGAFEMISLDKGFMCRKDLTNPTRYCISARSLGIPNKLYSDTIGTVFDSYQTVMNQWTAMNNAYLQSKKPNGKPWNPNDWIPSKIREQQFRNKAQQFIEGKRPFYERRKISLSRWQSINNIITNFLTPYFKEKDFRTISKEDVKAFYLHLLDLRDKNGQPYSDAHIKDILAMLKSIFIEYRPADVPEFPSHTVIPKKEKQWLGIERQMSIEPHIPKKYRLSIRTLQTTGMRAGEIRALQVNDMIDGALKVWKAFGDHKDDKGNVILKLSRKSGGEVTYPIPLDLWRDLQKHVEGKKSDDFIFSHEDGSPFGQNCMSRAWKKACKDAKVKYIPLQQASRHSMASQIMAEHKKKAIEEIQAKLGHSNRQTQKAYVVD